MASTTSAPPPPPSDPQTLRLQSFIRFIDAATLTCHFNSTPISFLPANTFVTLSNINNVVKSDSSIDGSKISGYDRHTFVQKIHAQGQKPFVIVVEVN
jgi:hypothetical protein